MPETGDGTQALDHAPACAGAAQQRLQSPLKGLRPRARRRGRSSFTAARTSDCNRPWRASDRAPAGAGAAHQRLQSPLAGLRPRARQPGRGSVLLITLYFLEGFFKLWHKFTAPMMLFLAFDVLLDPGNVPAADSERAVTALPLELRWRPQRLIDETR